jgi:putative ABC transport system substrate-binding protein
MGLLWVGDPATAGPYVQAIKEGLHEHGWIEGKTIRIVERHDYDDPERRPALVAEVVAMKVDVLYVSGVLLPTAQKATTAIPMVCPDFYDPIKEGFTTSLAKPDANITGISWQSMDLATKRLELTRELVPRARRIGWLYNAGDPGAVIELQAALAAARSKGIEIQDLGYRTPSEMESQLVKLKHSRLNALIVQAGPVIWPAIDKIVAVATGKRIPVTSEPVEFVRSGAMMSYGVDILAELRRATYYVDRILRGATPAQLPIEQATHFQLGLNVKTAKRIGLAIPPTIQSQATEIVR